MKIDSLLIKKADKAINEVGIVKKGQYDKVFKGYVSSFGASIAQAGLIPTIIFFEAKSEQAKERPKLVDALMFLLNSNCQDETFAQSLLKMRAKNEKDVYEREEKLLLKKVTEAMVAIKLALRLYKVKEKIVNEDE